jgi:hypothetical protein
MFRPFSTVASRLRYSLRGLLVAVTLLCFLVGWFAIRLRQAERQATAVKSLQAGHIVVGYDYMLDEQGEYTGSPDPPAGFFRELFGHDFFSSVVRVEYSAGQMPECGLAPLADVRGLRQLSLRGVTVGDADVDMNDLSGLESLDVAFTNISDQTVRHMTTLDRLSSLDLSGTVISDAGLKGLKYCRRLRELFLQDTFVSEQAVQSLRDANATLKVFWSPLKSQSHHAALRELAQRGAGVHFVESAEATSGPELFFVPGYRLVVIGGTLFGTTGKVESTI